jgi:hypothetical protein
MVAFQLSVQLLKMVAWGNAKIGVVHCIVDQLQFAEQPVSQVGGDFFRMNVFLEEVPEPNVMPTRYHFIP